MPNRTVTIVNKLGLHARAASKLVQLSSRFGCKIRIKYGSQEVDGKSIMSIMMLAASKGAVLEISTEGKQQEQALDAIEKLIHDAFGEQK